MKDKIIAEISSKLKEIYPDGTIYLDSVMQSTKDFYFVKYDGSWYLFEM